MNSSSWRTRPARKVTVCDPLPTLDGFANTLTGPASKGRNAARRAIAEWNRTNETHDFDSDDGVSCRYRWQRAIDAL
jgi:hypothetical protein